MPALSVGLSETSPRRPRAERPRVLLRASLIAAAVVVLAPTAIAVVAGFLPELPVVGRFGALVIPDLQWVLLGAAASAALALLAGWLGARGLTSIVMAAATLTLVGSAGIAGGLWWFAHEHGAVFSLVRQALTASAPAAQADSTVTYVVADGQALAAQIWRSPGNAPGATPSGRAAVLYLHGGGFSGGGLGSRPAFFRFLADSGIPVVDAKYRLAPPPRWDAAPRDALCALAWLEQNSASLGIDPSRIVVMGDSAGGNLALIAAYGAGTEMGRNSCAGRPSSPAAVIAIAPAADLAGIWQDATLFVDGKRFPESYIGGTPAEFPDRYAAASPLGLIRRGLPPTLIITGANDHLIRVERVQGVVDRLGSAGVDVSFVLVPFADHGFDGAANDFGEQLEEALVPAFIEAHT